MGATKYLQQLWNSDAIRPIIKNYMIRWRKEPVIVKLERPTRIDRARSLGYKAKNGFLIARIRIGRGGRKRMKFKGGRRSKHMRRRKVLDMNYQWVAEGRVARAFPNCEVLNSYYLAKDGNHYWFEVILVDPEIVKNYKESGWLSNKSNLGRVFHGKTSAGRRSRGLLNKGKGAEKLRPSRRAHF